MPKGRAGKSNSNYRFVQRYGQRVAAGLLRKYIGSLTQTMQRQSGQGAKGVITAQKDNALIYRRKKMPYRKKKAWLSFQRKNMRGDIARYASQFFVMTDNFVVQRTDAELASTINGRPGNLGLQGFTTFQMYTANGVTRALDQQIQQMLNNQGQTTSAARNDILHVQGMNYSVTLSNKNDTGTAVYADLYYYVLKKDLPDSYDGVSFSNVNALISRMLDTTLLKSDLTADAFTLDAGSYGVTPFQSKDLGKYIKIYKKTRHLIPENNFFKFDMNDPKVRTFNGSYIEDKLACKGTKGVIMITYAPPKQDISPDVNNRITQAHRLEIVVSVRATIKNGATKRITGVNIANQQT